MLLMMIEWVCGIWMPLILFDIPELVDLPVGGGVDISYLTMLQGLE